MPDDFVPFANPRPSGGAESDFRVRILPSAAATPAFVATTVPSRPHAHAHAAPPHGEPVLTLRKEGDRITGIRIQCGCGQILDLACEY